MSIYENRKPVNRSIPKKIKVQPIIVTAPIEPIIEEIIDTPVEPIISKSKKKTPVVKKKKVIKTV
jgi:hypothetical protein